MEHLELTKTLFDVYTVTKLVNIQSPWMKVTKQDGSHHLDHTKRVWTKPSMDVTSKLYNFPIIGLDETDALWHQFATSFELYH